MNEPIEVLVLKTLEKALPAPVSAELPPEPPATFYVLDKLSDRETEHIRDASFALQTYAPTKLAAARLSAAAAQLTPEALIMLDEIARVELENEYPFADTRTKSYRYQAVFNITYYGS